MNLTPAILLPSSVLIFLLNVAIASMVACGAGLAIVRLFRGMPLPMRHAVLVGAIVVTLVGPFIAVVMDASGIALVRVTTENPNLWTQTNTLLSDGEPRHSRLRAAGPDENAPKAGASAPALDESRAPAPTPQTSNAAPPTSQLRWTRSHSARLAGTLLAAIWTAGCLIGLALIARGLLQLRRFLKHLEPVSERRVNEVAAQAAAVVGLSTAPPIFQSRFVCAPLSVGLSRPRVVVPVEVLSSEDLNGWRGVLLHEFAHVARGDHYVGFLQRIVVTLFWWNPLVRLASARISVLREQICDDVATSGVASNDGYAAMLIELAGRVLSAPSLPATIGMFDGSRREFSDRVRRLFDHERSLVTNLDRPMKLVCAAVFVALLLVTGATTVRVQTAVAATETPESPAVGEEKSNSANDSNNPATSAAAAPAVAWPATLHGKVKDGNGKPLAGARVRFDLEKIHEYSIGRWDEPISTQSLVTDETGVYSFNTSEFPKMTHRPFSLTLSATADKYADAKTWTWYSRKDVSVGDQFQDVKMVPGRLVEGRCVDRSGNPVVGAVVKVASDYDMDNTTTSWAWDPRATNVQGEFQVSVPRETTRDIEFWIVHPDWAPQRVEVLEKKDRQPDVVLSPGGVLTGTVYSEDGSPVAGTVVVAESNDDGDLEKVGFAAQIAVKTNAEGRYRLPPLLGDYKVFLAQAERTDERLDDNYVVADVPPPLVVPAKVTLVRGESQRLDFRAGPTLTVRGHIRWPDDRPVAGADVEASYWRENFGSVELGDTETNAEGEYSIELPKPIDTISIRAIGAFDENRKWHYAHPAPDVDAESKGVQFIQLKNLETDRDDIDWVLKPDTD